MIVGGNIRISETEWTLQPLQRNLMPFPPGSTFLPIRQFREGGSCPITRLGRPEPTVDSGVLLSFDQPVIEVGEDALRPRYNHVVPHLFATNEVATQFSLDTPAPKRMRCRYEGSIVVRLPRVSNKGHDILQPAPAIFNA